MAADALGAMVARFAGLWLVRGYREDDFGDAVEQLTIFWGSALGLEHPRSRKSTWLTVGVTSASPSRRRPPGCLDVQIQ